MSPETLRPCPFCGGEVDAFAGPFGAVRYRQIRCEHCNARGPLVKDCTTGSEVDQLGDNADAAAKAWNKRPSWLESR